MPVPTQMFQTAIADGAAAIKAARAHKRRVTALAVALLVVVLSVAIAAPRVKGELATLRHSEKAHLKTERAITDSLAKTTDSLRAEHITSAVLEDTLRQAQAAVEHLLRHPVIVYVPKIVAETVHDVTVQHFDAVKDSSLLPAGLFRKPIPAESLRALPDSVPMVSYADYEALGRACRRVDHSCDATIAAKDQELATMRSGLGLAVRARFEADSARMAADARRPSFGAQLKHDSKVAGFTALLIGALHVVLGR